MGHARNQALNRALAGLLAASLCAQTRDPAAALAEARDRLLAQRDRLTSISCTVTMDRSYFERVHPPAHTSCDQIAADRRKNRARLKLFSTDRLRLKIFFNGQREVFAWPSPLAFESHSLDQVLLAGPLGTGGLGAFYLRLFEDPAASFEFTGEKDGKLEYTFSESTDSSHHTVRAGEQWLPAAHSGSLWIDSTSLDLEKFSVDTSTLPPETSMCEAASTVDYHPMRIGGENVLLPVREQSHDVLVNAQETDSVIAYSSCTDEPPANEPPQVEPALPEKLLVQLALDDPIDSATAAAGDAVAAAVTRDVLARDGMTIVLHKGTRVRGRILNLERWLQDENPFFVVAISFDAAEFNGVASPFRARLAGASVRLNDASSRWPEDSLVFATRAGHYVIPRGFESRWRTVK